MPFLVWLSNLASQPLVANVLAPALAKGISDFLSSQAKRIEQRAAVIQAKAASKIENDAARAEALREASKKLSAASARD